jgi:hypothetical protein
MCGNHTFAASCTKDRDAQEKDRQTCAPKQLSPLLLKILIVLFQLAGEKVIN